MTEAIRVLHVDDEPGFASMVGTFLACADDRIDVLPALSAQDGLALLDERDIDCIVSDHDMPGKNGIELLRAVRRGHPDLPFILYTGKGSEEIASEAISAGVTEYLQKESGSSQYEILRNRIQLVVEQRRAHENLAETERRLRTIAEHANDILWKFTGDWDGLLFINSQYEEIWGRSVDELRQRPRSFLEGIHPDDRSMVTDAMERLSSGESVDIEYRVNASEDFARWVWVQGEPVFDAEGAVEKVVGFAREITDRKQREEELEALRDRYEAFTRYSSDNITVIDGNGIIRYESPAVERLTGWRPDELEGENAFEYIHTDDREHALETFLGARDADEPVTDRAQYRFKTADGSWVWIESVGTNCTDTRIGGYVINSRDITERTEHLTAIERERDRFEALFKAVPEPIVHVSLEDDRPVVLRVNEAFEAVFGIDSSEAVGRSLDDLIVAEDRRTEAAEINRTVRETGRYQDEIRRMTGTGERPFLFTVQTIDLGDSTSNDHEAVATYVDLSEQKHRELELAHKNERLAEFASIVSHDLRNPLNIAEGRLALVRDEHVSSHLDELEMALDRMRRLIDDLLTLAQEGMAVPRSSSVDLEAMVAGTWSTIPSDEARLINEASAAVEADPDLLEQILDNLLRNAVQHGDSTVTVRVGVSDDGVFVEDDGPGIRPSNRATVFEAGYSTHPDGTGFGLRVVKQLVEAHGWSIRVTDGELGGARFELTGVSFPTAEVAEA